MKTKVTYVISNIDKSLSFEWIATYLNKDKFNLQFILINSKPSELKSFFNQHGIDVLEINFNGKRDYLKVLIKLIFLLKKTKPDVVHTHLFDASLIGLMAAKICGIKKRIHTRHHSDYHHEYFPKAVKYDRWCNWLSTDVIAISEVVKHILIKKENVNQNKIRLIHHGFELNNFFNITETNIQLLRSKYKTEGCYPIIGIISRQTKLKGIQYVIPAFKKLIQNYPNVLLILANANGDYRNKISSLLSDLPKINYLEINFESNIFALYKLFNIFVHVPISPTVEAFGQTYVEALAAGIPSVFTLSGIAHEFIINEKNALVVPYQNSEAIYTACLNLLNNVTLRNRLIEQGKNDVASKFELQAMITKLEDLYHA